MKKIIFLLWGTVLMSLTSFAQQAGGITHSGLPTHQPPFPVVSYQELPNPVSVDASKWKGAKGINLSWGSTDVRYKKEEPAPLSRVQQVIDLKAWRGERVAAQWVVWTDQPLQELKVEIGSLKQKGKESEIDRSHILSGFVRYVMTDELNPDGRGGCGHRPDASQFDSTLVADPIDHLAPSLSLPAYSTQGGWVRVWVPADAKPGVYTTEVTVKNASEELGKLTLRVHVDSRQLPAPEDWAFHLDLWQNPFAIARYYGVKPWSKEHFEKMRPYMEMYRDAGGKVITASIIHKPWNGQTYDPFETMVTWMKKADGTWFFDYTIFDRWVEFMMEIGIKKEITCYSMVPWRLSFQYYDQATNSLQEVKTKPGDKEFEKIWTAMLTSFASHLKEKGWFGITHISMDERPLDAMKETIRVIRKADPDFKISLAGALHEELSDELDDYCVALRMKYSQEMKNKRKSEGKVTTYYTSCEEPFPNTFTFCPPAECEWLGWYAAKENLDGYLRWAYNSWVIEPLLDSRFYTWAAGDTYLVYPGGRTSLRFERLVQGIQAYEKVNILRKEYAERKQKGKLKKLEKALEEFDEGKLPQEPAADCIKKVKQRIGL